MHLMSYFFFLAFMKISQDPLSPKFQTWIKISNLAYSRIDSVWYYRSRLICESGAVGQRAEEISNSWHTYYNRRQQMRYVESSDSFGWSWKVNHSQLLISLVTQDRLVVSILAPVPNQVKVSSTSSVLLLKVIFVKCIMRTEAMEN